MVAAGDSDGPGRPDGGPVLGGPLGLALEAQRWTRAAGGAGMGSYGALPGLERTQVRQAPSAPLGAVAARLEPLPSRATEPPPWPSPTAAPVAFIALPARPNVPPPVLAASPSAPFQPLAGASRAHSAGGLVGAPSTPPGPALASAPSASSRSAPLGAFSLERASSPLESGPALAGMAPLAPALRAALATPPPPVGASAPAGARPPVHGSRAPAPQAELHQRQRSVLLGEPVRPPRATASALPAPLGAGPASAPAATPPGSPTGPEGRRRRAAPSEPARVAGLVPSPAPLPLLESVALPVVESALLPPAPGRDAAARARLGEPAPGSATLPSTSTPAPGRGHLGQAVRESEPVAAESEGRLPHRAAPPAIGEARPQGGPERELAQLVREEVAASVKPMEQRLAEGARREAEARGDAVAPTPAARLSDDEIGRVRHRLEVLDRAERFRLGRIRQS